MANKKPTEVKASISGKGQLKVSDIIGSPVMKELDKCAREFIELQAQSVSVLEVIVTDISENERVRCRTLNLGVYGTPFYVPKGIFLSLDTAHVQHKSQESHLRVVAG